MYAVNYAEWEMAW